MRLRCIVGDFEIFIGEIINAVRPAMNHQLRQRAGRPCQLFARLVEMIGIEMRIAKCMHEFTVLQIGNSRNHLRQQRIGGDIEGHTEEYVRAALIELAG